MSTERYVPSRPERLPTDVIDQARRESDEYEEMVKEVERIVILLRENREELTRRLNFNPADSRLRKELEEVVLLLGDYQRGLLDASRAAREASERVATAAAHLKYVHSKTNAPGGSA